MDLCVLMCLTVKVCECVLSVIVGVYVEELGVSGSVCMQVCVFVVSNCVCECFNVNMCMHFL